MTRCPHCNTENMATSPYCERCGTSLEATNPYDLPQVEYRDYSKLNTETAEAANSHSPSQVVYADYTHPAIYEKMSPPSSPPPPLQGPSTSVPSITSPSYEHLISTFKPARPSRTVGGALFSILLYFVGALSTSLGVAFLVEITGIALLVNLSFMALLFLSITIMVLTLVFHKQPRLKWWHRLLWMLGITLIAVIAYAVAPIIFVVVLRSQSTIPSMNTVNTAIEATIGVLFLLYGLVLSFIALW
jgi:hypothetical protein